MLKRNRKKAFTIVELIIVIAVIGVLAAILIPTFINIIDKSNMKSALSDAKNALTAYISEASDTMGFTIEVPEYTLITVQKGSLSDGFRWYRFSYTADKGLIADPNLPNQPVADEESVVPTFGFGSEDESAPVSSINVKAPSSSGKDTKYQPAISKAQIKTLDGHVRIYLPFGYFTVTDATVFFDDVAAGEYHSAAIDKEGKLWTWGQNNYGQLGDGTTQSHRTTSQIMPDTTFESVSVGSSSSFAIDTDGNLWAWGDNYYGQLGDGTTSQRNSPVQVMDGTLFSAISAGIDHTLALDTSGNLWAWGENTCGQIGNGRLVQQETPEQILAGTTFSAISAGGGFSLAIASDGTLYAWGSNLHNQLGIPGTVEKYKTPQNVSNGNTFTKVAAGFYHSVAIDTDGDLFVAGNNINFQLGTGNDVTQDTFTRISVEGKTFTEVSCGDNYSSAIANDGRLYMFGMNNFGQLGINSKITGEYAYAKTPTVVNSLTDVVSISAGSCYMTAITENGSMYAWGDNYYGQLGSPLIWDVSWPLPTSISQWFAYSA